MKEWCLPADPDVGPRRIGRVDLSSTFVLRMSRVPKFPLTDHERSFGLDLARAAAIVCVLFAHGMGLWGPLVSDTSIGFFWLTGIIGVEIFFCLSGFLIGRILLDIQRRDPSTKAIGCFSLVAGYARCHSITLRF